LEPCSLFSAGASATLFLHTAIWSLGVVLPQRLDLLNLLGQELGESFLQCLQHDARSMDDVRLQMGRPSQMRTCVLEL
jgi:hypothetical protein